MTPECKYEKEIESLLDYRLVSVETLAGLKSNMRFMIFISMVIFTAVVGQIVLSLSQRNKAHTYHGESYSLTERPEK
jgi:hypothetical protein